jgi:hypothetical protein
MSFTARQRMDPTIDSFETLGDLSLFRQVQGTSLIADFAGIGASQLEVEVFNGPASAGSFIAPAGTLGVINNKRIERVTLLPGDIGWLLRFEEAATLTPTSGGSLMGDRIRISAVNPTEAPGTLHSLVVRGAHLDSLTVRNAFTASAQSPALPPPQLLSSQEVEITFPVESDVTYDIEQSESLQAGSWTRVRSVAGASGMTSVRITDERRNGPVFYRIRVR